MKLYVVTSGEYSDYGIEGIFDNKELAQKFINSFRKDEDTYVQFNEIAEMELNPYQSELKAHRKPYFVRMDKQGHVVYIEHTDSYYGFNNDNDTISFILNSKYTDFEMNIYLFADDEKHAIKISNEKRVKLLALNRWKVL